MWTGMIQGPLERDRITNTTLQHLLTVSMAAKMKNSVAQLPLLKSKSPRPVPYRVGGILCCDLCGHLVRLFQGLVSVVRDGLWSIWSKQIVELKFSDSSG
uniref:Uncharacterized protein n=1 Tax=Arundo donax TaxID=35708 RepID=A0A0A9H0R9_ARUDO